MIRVFIAEDQTIIRHGIAALLALTEDIRVVAEAADGEAALAGLLQTPADVLLLDIMMPRLGGIEVLKQLRRSGNSTPVIVLTTFDDDQLFLEAIQAGANGFLLKDVSLERLERSIRSVHGGQAALQPAMTERILRTVQQAGTRFESSALPERLTPREGDVLRLIAAGYSNREIAEALAMSEGSVKNHASSILSKLGARDRTRAVLRGIELGIL